MIGAVTMAPVSSLSAARPPVMVPVAMWGDRLPAVLGLVSHVLEPAQKSRRVHWKRGIDQPRIVRDEVGVGQSVELVDARKQLFGGHEPRQSEWFRDADLTRRTGNGTPWRKVGQRAVE
jgi:hypothetical protein